MMLSEVRRLWRALSVAGVLAAAALLFAVSAKAVDLEEIKSRGTIKVATEAAYAPFEFVQDGKIVGYDKDVLDHIVSAWGVKLEQLDLPFAGILTGLDQQKYDLVCTAMLMNPERTSKYAFTMPVALAEVVIVKRKGDDKIKGVEDLSNLVVGAPIPPAGPTAVLTKYNEELTANGKGAKQIQHFQGNADLFLALGNEQVDAAVDSTLTFAAINKEQPDKFEIVGKIGTPFYIGWAVRPDDTKFRDQLNDEIRKLRDSGVLTELQKKWFGFAMEIPDSGYLPPGAK
jgi:polar amino acid transport system substrate-binding protein